MKTELIRGAVVLGIIVAVKVFVRYTGFPMENFLLGGMAVLFSHVWIED